MLRPRIIPCLLLSEKGLVKTIEFKEKKYVGDPINAIRIFNEKECDELMVLDIDASANDLDIDFELIKKFAAECRMPLCYGGGIKSLEQARKIISLGVEKIAISSSAVEDINFVSELSKEIGSQSIVVVLDYKKNIFGRNIIYTCNGQKNTKKEVTTFIEELQEHGAGEIVLNSIKKDGSMTGYDVKFASEIRKKTSIPLTILGGAGSYKDIRELLLECGILGASAGSLFVFKGIYRAVLINYPDSRAKKDIIENTFKIDERI